MDASFFERGAEARTPSSDEDFRIMELDRHQMNGGAVQAGSRFADPAQDLVMRLTTPTTTVTTAACTTKVLLLKIYSANRDKGDDMGYFPSPTATPSSQATPLPSVASHRDCYAKFQITGITSASGESLQPSHRKCGPLTGPKRKASPLPQPLPPQPFPSRRMDKKDGTQPRNGPSTTILVARGLTAAAGH